MTPDSPGINEMDWSVKHRHIMIDGVGIFYREAGPEDAPVVLMPHGYPSSSFQFRNFMPALADRWRLIAPDFPAFDYSDTPDRTRFSYTFTGYTDLLGRFAAALNVTKYVVYLHDYGSQIGLRLAMQAPERVAGLIIQNGDIYEDELGPKYQPLKEYWANPTPKGREKLGEAVSEHGFRNGPVGRLVRRGSPAFPWPRCRDEQVEHGDSRL